MRGVNRFIIEFRIILRAASRVEFPRNRPQIFIADKIVESLPNFNGKPPQQCLQDDFLKKVLFRHIKCSPNFIGRRCCWDLVLS